MNTHPTAHLDAKVDNLERALQEHAKLIVDLSDNVTKLAEASKIMADKLSAIMNALKRDIPS